MTLTADTFKFYDLPDSDKSVKEFESVVNAINNKKVVVLGVSGKKGAGKDTIAEGLHQLIKERDHFDINMEAFGNALKGEATSIIAQIRHYIHHGKGVSKEDFLVRFAATNVLNVEEAGYIFDLMKPSLTKFGNKKINGWTRSEAVWSLLRFLGTDVRQPQDKLYWARRIVQTVCANAHNGISTIVTDVRFLHEVKAIQEIGGYVVRIDISPEVQMRRLSKRDNVKATLDATQHRSETELDDYPDFDLRINNDSEGHLDTKLAEIYVDWQTKVLRKQAHG